MKNKANNRKIIQALNYFAEKQPSKEMNKMKAYKLLWLADRYHVRQYGRTITGDQYFALPFGLIPSNTKDMLDNKIKVENLSDYIENIDSNTYKSKICSNLKVFSKTDMEVLNLILSKFSTKSPFELSEFSHKFPEWKRFEKDLKDSNRPNSYKVKTNDFFDNINEESCLFNDDNELLSITKSLYNM